MEARDNLVKTSRRGLKERREDYVKREELQRLEARMDRLEGRLTVLESS